MLRAAARRLSTLPLTHYKKWGSRELLILPPRFQSKAVLIQRYHISYFSAQTYSSLQSSSFQNSLPYNSEESILLTESFIKRMKELQKEDMKEEIMLRLSVESGGCSGFQYSFILDDKCNPDDRVFEKGGVKLVVDSISFEFVKGATVDFVDELIRSSFMVTLNPNAGGGCSCGSSFTVK